MIQMLAYVATVATRASTLWGNHLDVCGGMLGRQQLPRALSGEIVKHHHYVTIKKGKHGFQMKNRANS